ncbi:MAG: type II secretion system GspH family protein [Proteobacteria bacterium]|nr:type II secretion system GspH family protein [Pseudomonadota bacterium]
MPKFNPTGGFSLVELAIVLMIITIAFGSIAQAGLRWSEQRRVHEKRATLELAREALIAYAMQRGRLPCPASTNIGDDRLEVLSGQSCRSHSGLLPSASLGLHRSSRTRLHYAVSPQYADATPRTAGTWPCTQSMQFASFNLCDMGVHRIYSARPVNTRNLIASDVVAVVLDPGTRPQPRGADESENLNGSRIFIRAVRGDEFDDEMVWISSNTIKFQLARVGMMY